MAKTKIKKYAVETYYRDANGKLVTVLVDAATGEPVKDDKGYRVVTQEELDAGTLGLGDLSEGTDTSSTPAPSFGGINQNNQKVFTNRQFEGGRDNSSGTKNGFSGRNISNDFGYHHKPAIMGAASLIPGPAGLAGKALNLGWDYNNKVATKKATEMTGAKPKKEKKSVLDHVAGLITGEDQGFAGQVKVGDKLYDVSLDQKNAPSSLTPMEAVRRQEGYAKQHGLNPADVQGKSFGIPAHYDTNPVSGAAARIHPELDPGRTAPAPTNSTSNINNNISLSERKQAFYDQQKQYAERAGLTGVAADVAIAQAGLETGYGLHAPNNNYHGIKAGKNYKGSAASFMTTEQNSSGVASRQNAKFRSYTDPVESYKDWAKQMERNWPGVLNATTYDEAVDALQNHGRLGSYATDKKYRQKLDPYFKELESLRNPAAQALPQIDSMVNPDTYMTDVVDQDTFEKYSKNYYENHVVKSYDSSTPSFGSKPGMARQDTPSSGHSSFGMGANRPASGGNFGNYSSPSEGGSRFGGSGLGSPGAKSSGGNMGRNDTPSSGHSNFGGSFGGNTGGNTNMGRSDTPSSGKSSFGGGTVDKDKSQGPSGGGYGGWGGPH